MSSDFSAEIAQNEYLPVGGEDVSAIVTVTSPDTGPAAPAGDRGSAEIIIIDCSGSMRSPRTKIEQARAATAAGPGHHLTRSRDRRIGGTRRVDGTGCGDAACSRPGGWHQGRQHATLRR